MRESRPLASRERQPCRELESLRWVESRATRLHQSTMSLRPGTLAAGFVWPCLPTKTHEPPSGLWIHEIKHDGFRIIARKCLSNIDSRRASNEQHRFKNPFAQIRLFSNSNSTVSFRRLFQH